MTNACVLLTGSTGFVGKVVLSELLRRQQELQIATIFLVIRPTRSQNAQERFKKITQSQCFKNLPSDWPKYCQVVEADLEQPLTHPELNKVITHVVHCAASIEFNLSVGDAAKANIVSALNVLTFAQNCTALKRMVSVSTAYVTPHQGEGTYQVQEQLAPLQRSATSLFAEICAEPASEALDKRLLEETGHPNTYTLTKCIAEHLLLQKRQHVPLTIVRPSIVSACRQYPHPAWIDSRAALAGFVTLIGAGFLRAVNVDPKAHLDVIACDDVAARIIAGAFSENQPATRILHATAGIEKSNTIQIICARIVSHFERHPLEQKPVLYYQGSLGVQFTLHDLLHHRLPYRFAEMVGKLLKKPSMAKQAKRLNRTIASLHQQFPYFTHKTFDFRSSLPLENFDALKYVDTVCQGSYEHLLRGNPRRVRFAGKKFLPKNDLSFALSPKIKANPAARLLAYGMRKALRLCANEVTFDLPSFEQALQQVPAHARLVIAPTHRSYLDFLVCPLLFYSRPDLNITLPKIAAADEFARIPVVGALFEKAGAFFVRRGVGKATLLIRDQIQEHVKHQDNLMFFIEGMRSRTRQFLKPRTGLLRTLHATEQTFVLLPIAISYEKLPEEKILLEELRTGIKPKMQLTPLLGWLTQLLRRQVDLGQIHLSCSKPIVLEPKSDVRGLADEVIQALQRKTVCTTYHLQAFVLRHSIEGVDVAWLQKAIEERGGEVHASEIKLEAPVDPALERCLRYAWEHWFYSDLALTTRDTKLKTLLHLLFDEHSPKPMKHSVPTIPQDSGIYAAL